ncbi:MAG: CmpA/NrtA family ABC transporter substrate-binding protein [Puniceicoccaceae bacterium]
MSARMSGRVLSLGFVPLVDCAPLVAAYEWGFFKNEGLEVKLSREIGWASIREKLIYGELEAGQALAPLLFRIKLGLGCAISGVMTAFVLSLQGNAITLSRDLRNCGVQDAKTLGKLVRSQLPRRMKFGVVSLYSMHHILLRSWLAGGGIDADRDIKLVVLPPRQMCQSLASGSLDGYCVGEPWNTVAVSEKTGWCPVVGGELSPLHIEKVLLVRGDFAAVRAQEHAAMIRALHAAAAACDGLEGRRELVKLLSRREYLNVPQALLAPSLIGPFSCGDGSPQAEGRFHIFHRGDANLPSVDRGYRLFRDMQVAGLIPDSIDDPTALLNSIFREDLYREALGDRLKTASNPFAKPSGSISSQLSNQTESKT